MVFVVGTLLATGSMTLCTLYWMLAYGVDAPVRMPRGGTVSALSVLLLSAPLFLLNILAACFALRR